MCYSKAKATSKTYPKFRLVGHFGVGHEGWILSRNQILKIAHCARCISLPSHIHLHLWFIRKTLGVWHQKTNKNLGWSTWHLAFGCWITWFISSWETATCKAEQIHKMSIIFTQNHIVILWILLSLENNYFFFSLR